MNENQKLSLNEIVLVVLSVIMATAIAFLGWTANSVFEMSAELARVKAQAERTAADVKEIQDRGSPVIQAVMVRLDTLQAGQTRIEAALNEHLKTRP